MERETLFFVVGGVIFAVIVFYVLFLIWSKITLAMLKDDLRRAEKRLHEIRSEYDKKISELGMNIKPKKQD